MSFDKDCVKVTKITKIPSQFYVPSVNYITKVNQSVKIQVDNKTAVDTEILQDAVAEKTNFIVYMQEGIGSFAAKTWETLKKNSKKCLSLLKYFFMENTKKIAVSGGASLVLASVAGMVMVSTCSFAYQVKVGDRVIGLVKDVEVYYQILSDVKEEVSLVSEIEFQPIGDLDIDKTIIQKGKFTREKELKERLRSTCKDMIPAYAIVIDEQQTIALVNENAAIEVLETYKGEFVSEAATAVSFANAVEVAHQFVPKGILMTPETALQTLREGKYIQYIPPEGETLGQVAEKFNVSMHDIIQSNVIEDIDAVTGCKLKIYTDEPLIQVKTVEHIQREESIGFEIVQEKDASKYEGSVNVIQKGEEGLRFIEAYVTKVNGMETDKDIIKEDMLKTPVRQIEKIGTREVPAPIGTGLFATPASGSISSRFGPRWGRHHDGIDYAAPVGTPILAADTGKVTYAQYHDGGYGYMVKIDHGNGFETYYAHCSEILVNVGDIVSKKDIIGKVGNTGRSTGPHLHFEVRKDGVAYDPLAYLNQ